MTVPPHALAHVPVAPFMAPRTAAAPGVGPLAPEDWLHSDETYQAQMAMRDALIAETPEDVIAVLPGAEAACAELRDLVAAEVVARHGARMSGGDIVRADGVRVGLDGDRAIAVAGRLAQEDFLVMDKPEGAAEHVLTAGVLCFPAHWTLSEKIGRPLIRIHRPVPDYERNLAPRVQRFFDAVRPEKPLWRANWHFSATPEIRTPVREADKAIAPAAPAGERRWLRVERQTVRRLPRSGAVIFAVRTLISALDGLTPEQWRGLRAALLALPREERLRRAGPALLARIEKEAGAA